MILFGAILGGAALYFIKSKITKKNKKQLVVVNSQLDTQKINHELTISLSALGLCIGGHLYPLLTPLGVIGLAYLSVPFILRGYHELFDKRQIKANVLDAVISIALFSLHYFFATALFFTFYNVSQKLLSKTYDLSKKRLVNILGDMPQTVWLSAQDTEVAISFEKVKIGDILVIHTGELIPVDGIIVSGMGTVDEHKLTGEAQPVEKSTQDVVFASTLVVSGKLHIKVEKAGNDTVAAKIGEVLNHTVDYKSNLQSKGEAVVDKSAAPTLLTSAVTFSLLGPASAAATLLASFGYNMRLIAPMSVLNYLQLASEKGILVKDGRALEQLPRIDTVVFDKTGTLTQEQPIVGKIHCFGRYTEEDILGYAAAAEHRQTHPLAQAIIQEAQCRHIDVAPIEDASYDIGYGIKVKLAGQQIHIGSARFMVLENIIMPDGLAIIQKKCYARGDTLIYMAVNRCLAGAIEIQTAIRAEALQVVQALQAQDINVIIISGDKEEPTQKLAKRLNINQYFAETLPEHKADLIKQLQDSGKHVCFVGDGINDSIALKTANVSISLLGASTIATDNAQIILMDKMLNQLPYLFDLAKNFEDNMRKNMAITILPGFICIGGVYLLHFGIMAAIFLYNMSLAVGVVNASLPKIKGNKLIQNVEQN